MLGSFGRAASLTPERLAQAQTAAFRVAAQNVLRMCVTSLEQYKVDNGDTLNADWNGKSCQEAELISQVSNAAVSKSQITLHPESVEGYQVTVWARTGEAVTLPEVLTRRPPEESPPSTPTLPQPLGLILGGALALLVGGFVLLLITFKLPSSRIVGGLGMGLGAFLLATALLFPVACCPITNDSWVPSILRALGELARLLLTGTALLVPPRLACWWGREAWWISVGNSVLVSAFVLIGMLGSLKVKGLSDGLQVTFQYGLPLVSASLTMWVIWRRLRRGKPPTLSP